jgi:hypothetical protein
MSIDSRRWAVAIGLALLFAGTAASLDTFGRTRRIQGPAHALSTGLAAVVTIDAADEAFRVWSNRGLHGRVVVALSSRLYFVSPEWEAPPVDPDEAAPANPAVALERILDPRNFLLVSMERGVAREVVHVLPERVLQEKSSLAAGMEGVRQVPGGLAAPYTGSPRRLTTLGGLDGLREPVLLFVSASFFRDRDATDVFRALSSGGVRTDLVVLCRSRDDAEVGSAEREQLSAFEALLRRS